ncbi:MAG: type I restriction endonuclease subunit R [Bacilli bacterium]|jgi:type I restriction enzyme R subunit
MPTDISEKELETILVSYLRDHQGYEEGVSSDYNKEFGLDTERVKRFILSTQKEKVENTACFTSPTEEHKFFSRLSAALSKRGVTDVLRKGFKYISEIFDMYYPTPSALNPTAQQYYDKNIFCVTRQLYYSKEKTDSIDVYISLNGLPIMTMELKNHYTGQTVENAIKQYKEDRDPKADPTALILQKRRCAVHFAVDDDDIMMCTELKGNVSWFLPFNKGVNGGAGNPINPNGVRTAYLWEDILGKYSLSDILENYAQITFKEKDVKNKKTGKKEKKTVESIIWPRYHQLDCVRKLLQATRYGGVGQKFLIQHSAGSGKSNSITWLAYQLVGLLYGTTPILDTVIVVTDRVNLDTQIRDNINSFKRLSNLVDWADSSQTLKNALQDGKKIIITIVHKFPYILEAIGSELKNKHFGIIIDEAHSSQNGSLSAKMNIALSGNVAKDEDDLEDKLNAIIEGRKMVKNANYYAFTATPKSKTLQMFGTANPQPDGKVQHLPFHEYTMKQAIEEGFIMDVLKNYTTYASFYKVIKTVKGDPEFDQKEAQKKIRAYVESRPETIRQKAVIIVNHFHTAVLDKGKIGGQARAMVVTSSILRAISFYYEIESLLKDRKSPYRAIVAFSGSKEWHGKQVTEADINGFPSKDIEENMGEDPYRILVVADKFQTGYDQPLLHSMYVDKELSDVAAVQTLSRLNRCHPLKRDTFVLDFYNDTDRIQKSFQRFYKATILSEEADPNKLNDQTDEIEKYSIYTEEEVRDLNIKYWNGVARELLDPIINKSVERFKMLDENSQIKCKSSIKGFLRYYPFIAAVTPFCSKEWEMLNTYYMLLVHKLPKLKGEDFTDGLEESIDLDQLQVTKMNEMKIELENKDTEVDPIPMGIGKGGKKEPEMAKLSDILEQFNDIHWQNIEAVKVQIDSLPDRLQADQNFVNAAKNSNKETAQKQGFTSMMGIVIKMMSESTEFCRQYLDNKNFQNAINERVFQQVYSKVSQGQ